MKTIVLFCLSASLVIMGSGGCNGGDTTPPSVQAVFVEIDKMSGTDFPPDFVADASTSSNVTFEDIFDDGKISLDVRKDDASIAVEATVSRQRLHQLMTANRNSAFGETSDKWSTYAIVVKAFQPNPNVLGIMFDSDIADLDNLPREGCAIFYDAHADPWSGQRLADELFLTSAHELGHCFNLHHTDWEGTSFNNGSTVMSYSLTPTVLWKVSNRSIEHLKRGSEHPTEYVKPRSGGKAFGTIRQHHCDNHQSTPIESYTCEASTSPVTRK